MSLPTIEYPQRTSKMNRPNTFHQGLILGGTSYQVYGTQRFQDNPELRATKNTFIRSERKPWPLSRCIIWGMCWHLTCNLTRMLRYYLMYLLPWCSDRSRYFFANMTHQNNICNLRHDLTNQHKTDLIIPATCPPRKATGSTACHRQKPQNICGPLFQPQTYNLNHFKPFYSQLKYTPKISHICS